MRYCIIWEWRKGRGEEHRGGKKEVKGDTNEEQQPLCISVTALLKWGGKEDAPLKSIQDILNISSAGLLSDWMFPYYFIFCLFFSQCICPHISIPRRKCAEGAGIWKEMRRPPCQCAYMNRFTSFMTSPPPPHPSPPTACSLTLSCSIFLSLSLSLPAPSLPQNSILYLLVMERSSAVLCQAQ